MAQITPFIARNHFWPTYPHGLRGLSANTTRTNLQVPPFGGFAPAGMGLLTAGAWLFQDKLITSTYLPTPLKKVDLEQKRRKKVLQMVLPLGSLQGFGALPTFVLSPESSPTGTRKSKSDGVNRWLRIWCTLTHILHGPVSGPEISRRGIWPRYIQQNHGHTALKPLLASVR